METDMCNMRQKAFSNLKCYSHHLSFGYKRINLSGVWTREFNRQFNFDTNSSSVMLYHVIN